MENPAVGESTVVAHVFFCEMQSSGDELTAGGQITICIGGWVLRGRGGLRKGAEGGMDMMLHQGFILMLSALMRY